MKRRYLKDGESATMEFAAVAPRQEENEKNGRTFKKIVFSLTDGTEFEATEYLARMIGDEFDPDMGKPRLLNIRRYKKAGKTAYEVVPMTGLSLDGDEDPFEVQQSARPPFPTPGAKLFEELVADYSSCLKRAKEVAAEYLEDPTNEDVRSIATALYIQATRENVNIPK